MAQSKGVRKKQPTLRCRYCEKEVKGQGRLEKHEGLCTDGPSDPIELDEVSKSSLKKGFEGRVEFTIPNYVNGKVLRRIRESDGITFIIKADDGRTVSVKERWITNILK